MKAIFAILVLLLIANVFSKSRKILCKPSCGDNGDCVPAFGGGTRCLCKKGYVGATCDTRVECNPSCKNGGKCNANPIQGNPPICTCPPGFTGPRCENSTSSCNGTCANNGQCIINPVDGKTKCLCQPGFGGINCEVKIECNPPCGQFGKCEFNATLNATRCKCLPFHTADATTSCGKKPNFNCSGPCPENQFCNMVNGQPKCTCLPGFSDEDCSTFNCFGISNRNASVCLGNGVCERPDYCKCQKGFGGVICNRPFENHQDLKNFRDEKFNELGTKANPKIRDPDQSRQLREEILDVLNQGCEGCNDNEKQASKEENKGKRKELLEFVKDANFNTGSKNRLKEMKDIAEKPDEMDASMAHDLSNLARSDMCESEVEDLDLESIENYIKVEGNVMEVKERDQKDKSFNQNQIQGFGCAKKNLARIISSGAGNTTTEIKSENGKVRMQAKKMNDVFGQRVGPENAKVTFPNDNKLQGLTGVMTQSDANPTGKNFTKIDFHSKFLELEFYDDSGNKRNVDGLNEKVKMEFTSENSSELKDRNIVCKFFNETRQDWDDKGVTTDAVNQDQITCSTNHNTIYAALASLGDTSSASSLALSSIAVIIISMIALLFV